MMRDPDHTVRKEAVQLLSALVHTKPVLVAPLLEGSLPLLYEQTTINKALVRVVDLGPFKQTIDDGLSLRKATFECIEVRAPNLQSHFKIIFPVIQVPRK